MTRAILEREAGPLTVNYFGDPQANTIPLLFIHPINLRGSCWTDVVSAFAESRYCIVPDMRGFGDSPPSSVYGVDQWAQDCLDAVDSAGIEKVHVVGGSLGGSIATYLASIVPGRVVSLVAVGSQMYTKDKSKVGVISELEGGSVPEMFSKIIPKYSLGPAASRFIIDKTLATTNPNDAETIREIWDATVATDVRSNAEQVTCPATVISGEYDLTCTPENGELMAKALRGRYVVMRDVGHLPMLENPSELAELLVEHLSMSEVVAA